MDGAPGRGLQEMQERSVGATEHTFVHIMLRQEDLPELQLAHGKRKKLAFTSEGIDHVTGATEHLGNQAGAPCDATQ